MVDCYCCCFRCCCCCCCCCSCALGVRRAASAVMSSRIGTRPVMPPPRGYPGTWAWRCRGWVGGCRLRTSASVVIRCAAAFRSLVVCCRLWIGLACSLLLICWRRLISARRGWDFLTSASCLAGLEDSWKRCRAVGFAGRRGSVLASIAVRKESAPGRPALPSCES